MRFSPIARGLLCAGVLISQAGGASAQDHVLAAWSQLFGEIDPAKADQVTPPTAYFRFVTDAPDCTGFSVQFDTADQVGQDWPNAVNLRAGGFSAVRVCSVPMAADWTAAHLYQNGAQAVLTSQMNKGSYLAGDLIYFDSTYQHLAPWAPNPVSNGQPVSVVGPGAIGQNGDLTLVTLGDSGCRGWPILNPTRSQKRYDQNCDGDWPLDWLSVQAAKAKPDMVIHVGDYRYFYESRANKSWEFWQKDFFPAAQPLLSAAPWVFSRGNHEGCSHGELPFGGAYFQLFGDPAGDSCTAVDAGTTDGQPNMYGEPWFFDVQPGGILGASGFGPGAHRFVSIDVNNFKDDDQSPNVAEGTAHFKKAKAMVAKGPASSWWMAHTPAVELLYYGGSEHGGDSYVLQALVNAGTDFCGSGTGEGRCRPSQILLGHQHLYQDVSFPTPKTVPDPQKPGQTMQVYPTDGPWLFPRQMIVGHGGTKIDNGNPAPRGHHHCNHAFSDFTVSGQTLTGIVYTETHHGLVVWTRSAGGGGDQSGWTPRYLWNGDTTLHPAPAPTDGTKRRTCL